MTVYVKIDFLFKFGKNNTDINIGVGVNGFRIYCSLM